MPDNSIQSVFRHSVDCKSTERIEAIQMLIFVKPNCILLIRNTFFVLQFCRLQIHSTNRSYPNAYIRQAELHSAYLKCLNFKTNQTDIFFHN